jgi:class 3 adenylate cyclase/tetratricopeptide (TPR) repeat protein
MARTETVTVVFTDVVGSTELASRLGHDAYESLRRSHFEALRSAVAKHNGTEIKTTGDGLMLRFGSAADAVACAIAMQQAVNAYSRQDARARLHIRVGVSSGEATKDGGDLYGPPVVEASRLCAAASAGQILVSDLVRNLTRGTGHRFTSVGDLTLKGLPEPVPASEVVWESLPVKADAISGVFARSGEFWTVGCRGTNVTLKDIKGLAYIQRLLQHPGEEFHALDLLSALGGGAVSEAAGAAQPFLPEGTDSVGRLGDSGAALDARAKLEYKRKILELNEELEELRERGDDERASRVESEIEFLRSEILRAVGLGGRDRRVGSASERARLNVSRAIRSALQKISEYQAFLGELLDRSMRTGSFCSYVADTRMPIAWTFSLEGLGPTVEAQTTAPFFLRRDTSLLRAFTEQTKFVGRGAERTVMHRLLDQALRSEGRVVMISGAAGIGKTRFAHEFGIDASRRGFLVRSGNCYDRDDSVPYVPFVEILEEALAKARNPQDFREALGDDAAEIARLLPQLRRLFPDISAPLQLPAEQSRRVLFNAIAGVLARTTRNQAVVLSLDDLQWADEGTTSLLSFLAPLVAKAPVLIVGTHRDSELDPARPLAKLLDELIRLHVVERIILGRLPQNAVGEMVRALSAREPPDTVVSLIYSETDGNPFFVEELFHHLVEQGKLIDSSGEFRRDLKIEDVDVPRSLRVIIGRRLVRLSEDTQRILGTAAAIGRSFTFELLEASTRMEPDRLLDCVEQAEKAGLIYSTLEYPDARFQFSHELIRQAVVSGLSAARRQRLHLDVADAIERIYSSALEDRAEDLAHHFWQAGAAADPNRTVRYLSLAAKRARDQGALTEAEGHYRQALVLLDTTPETPVRDQQELTLQVDLGQILIATKGYGAPDVAQAYGRARVLGESLGDPTRLLYVMLGYWLSAFTRGELLAAQALADELLTAAELSGNPPLRVWGNHAGGVTRYHLGDLTGALTLLSDALRFHDPNDYRNTPQDPGVLARCYISWVQWQLGAADTARACIREVLSHLHGSSRAFDVAFVESFAAGLFLWLREPEHAREHADALIACANQHHLPFFAADGSILRGRAIAELGQAEGAELIRDGIKRSAASGQRTGLAYYLGYLAEAQRFAGAFGQALSAVEEALDSLCEERIYQPRFLSLRAEIRLQLASSSDHRTWEMAERDFREAIGLAHEMNAKFYELRATLGLARMLKSSGDARTARDLLEPIRARFTEGLETPDLVETEALLRELGARLSI